MDKNYNKLTVRLLAEGYTAENHPDYVMVGRGRTGAEALDNYEGGFQYFYWYAAERTYETPCGLLVKGKETNAGLTWFGTEYRHENDNPVIRCPKGCEGCRIRPEPFRSEGIGINLLMCPVKATDREWKFEESCEKYMKEYQERLKAEKAAFILAKNGRVCEHHMRHDDATGEWKFNYDARQCASLRCFGKNCPVLGKTISNEKGNVYYDIEVEGRDYSKDGTFFEGERFHFIHRGFQVFEKPVPLDIARVYARLNKADIINTVRWSGLKGLYDSLTVYKAERGEIDLSWSVISIRAEKRNVRDLDQDLRDIEAGIMITHNTDSEKSRKEEKRQRREESLERQRRALSNKIIKDGLLKLDTGERKRAAKLLERSEIVKLQKEHERQAEEKKNEPKQMTLFDIMEEQQEEKG